MELTPSNITFVIGIAGAVFTVYNYFRNPQQQLEKTQAVNETASEGAAKILAQQVQWEKESTEKRFTEMGNRLADATTMAQNHIHTVDVKLDGLVKVVSDMNLALSTEVAKLGTIINERIPKK